MIDEQNHKEKELLKRVAQGEQSAFRELYAQWHQLLAAYIFRIAESKELTEEIVQDVFTKIWMAREALAEIRNFKHYLITVSRNQAFDVLRKNLRLSGLHREWERSAITNVAEDEVSSQIAGLIDEAINRLSPRQKEVWLLSRHERLSYQEIADKLSISYESVKTHLKMATRSLTAFIRSRMPLLLFLISCYKKF